MELQAHMRLVRDSRRAVEGLRKITALEAFAFNAMNTLDQVESQMGVARDFFDRACVYFGIETGAMDSHDFFEILFAFLDSLMHLIEKIQKIKEKKKRLDCRNTIDFLTNFEFCLREADRSVKAKVDKLSPLPATNTSTAGADPLSSTGDTGGPRKARKSVFQKMAGAFSGGPPRPPVPVFKKPPIE